MLLCVVREAESEVILFVASFSVALDSRQILFFFCGFNVFSSVVVLLIFESLDCRLRNDLSCVAHKELHLSY